MYWDDVENDVGWTQKIYWGGIKIHWDGDRKCIWMEIENVLGWTSRMYRDGLGKSVRMTGPGP
eukprot:898780-Karenia_brevis.AAC.1